MIPLLNNILRRTSVFSLTLIVLTSITAGRQTSSEAAAQKVVSGTAQLLTLSSDAPVTSAEAAVLMESDTGMILLEKNAESRMAIASTTKILTALVVLEHCAADEEVRIGSDFPAIEGSSIYLKPGDTLTVSDLLYGLLLESGNDAAYALAIHVSGSVDAFAELMNQKANALECRNSHFVNPHGLDSEDHYASAHDLALIARAAMQNNTFSSIVSTKRHSTGGRYFKNHNKLLWTCPGAIGVKTGYTESSGRSLVSCVDREGMRLICVTLSAPNDWNDHKALYNWAYGAYKCVRLIRGDASFGSVPVISGTSASVTVQPERNLTVLYSKDDTIEMTWEIPKFVYAPVDAGEKAGNVTIRKNGETDRVIPLRYGNSVGLDSSVPMTLWERFRWSLSARGKETFVRSSYTLQGVKGN